MLRTAQPRPRSAERTSMPQIAIEPVDAGFAVCVGGTALRLCADELNAHHWGKHAFEAVNSGLRQPGDIDRAMAQLCRAATRFNLHH